jgi:hypothetical protein
MLLATTAVAVTVYSLLYASTWLGNLYYTAAAAVIVLAIAAAIQFQGERRAFWLGFALVAGAFMWFAVQPSPSQLLASNSLLRAQLGVSGADDPQLITTKLLQICYEHYCLSEKWSPDSAYTRARQMPGLNVTSLAFAQRFPQFDPNRIAFVTTGNASLALLFGWLGGVASRRMYRSRAVD